MKFTSAHWGCYEIAQDSDEPQLSPVTLDPLPSEIGKGWTSGALDPKVRVARPSVREGWLKNRDRARTGSDRFVEIEWDDALDLVAGELSRVREAHGNTSIFAGSYGWASAGRFHHAQSQLRRFMNLAGGYVGARTTYSHAAAEIIFPYITGHTNLYLQENMTSWPHLAQRCETLLSFGGISGRTAQIASGGTSRHEVPGWLERATSAGMKVIGVSPVQSDLSDLSGAEWVPIRPGTDVALMLALAHEILTAGAHDTAFLERCTSGWQAFKRYLTGADDGQPKSASWAAPICDLPIARIQQIAARLAATRSMISVAWGLQRADHGEQPVWMGLTLAAMLGQIGKAGTGFGFGYGSVAPVGRAKTFVNWPSVPQGTNPVKDVIPVSRIADALLYPGDRYFFDGKTCTYPDLQLVYWAGGNPFHHHQDLFRLEAAWQRPETIIVHEHSWTATARRADIVLPATTPLERSDIMMNKRDPALVYMSPAVAARGEARNDHVIFAGLAQRLGFEDEFTAGRSEDEWLAHLWAGAQAAGEKVGLTLPDFDAFRTKGLYDLPEADTSRILFEEFVVDPDANPLKTRSGKLEIFSETIACMHLDDCVGHPAWHPPVEGGLEVARGELHLLSPQPKSRLHSQLDTGSASMATKVSGREPCILHREVAAELGIIDGEVILLESARGACLAGAVLSDGIRKDCVALATGAWFDPQVVNGRRLDIHGNPNSLTIDKGASSLSQGSIAHTTVVKVSRWDGPLPEVSVRYKPQLVPIERTSA